MDIIQRRKEIINWERTHRNLLNRSDNGDTCLYFDHNLGPGCAVGRLVEDVAARKHLDAIGGTVNKVFEHLPGDVQALGSTFLLAMQRWHDSCLNFTEEGLSKTGTTVLNNIEKEFT